MAGARVERVLLVEDEPDIRGVAKMALERFGGLEVAAVGSGEEALGCAVAFAPDVVLLDVMMPVLDGPETLLRLRALAPLRHTPVVFLTAKAQPADIEHLKRLGARGVIAKPFDPVALPRRVEEIVAGRGEPEGSGGQGAALDELQALRREYAGLLRERTRSLAEAWAGARAGGSGEPRMRQLAHALAGSGATLGFPEVSTRAGELERMLGLRAAGAGGEELAAAIDALVERLREVALSGEPEAASFLPPVAATGARATPVALVEDDQVLARALQAELRLFGFEASILATPALLDAELRRRRPAAVLMDIVFDEGDLAGPRAVLDSAILRAGDIPVVFISGRTDFDARLAAARAGAAEYLAKPLRIADLVDVLDRITDRNVPEPYRVLVVGAEPAACDRLAAALRAAGLGADILTDPAGVPAAVGQGGIDAVVLHGDLAVCTAAEMSKVIGQVDRGAMLPVLPARDGLVAAVRAEARRFRMQRALLAFDTLTGLPNRSRVLEQVEQEADRAVRYGQPLSAAMIDLDGLGRLNEVHGHAAGDRVLTSLARFLRHRLRRCDFVGRHEGTRFVLLMPATPAAAAAALVDRLRREFSAMRHFAAAGSFGVTFSAGIASAPPATAAAEIAEEAGRALYRAKAAGRDRVESIPLS